MRNHRAPGIDFASHHGYVDQWLCTERGSTADGQLSFFSDWLDAHQQAAEEELQMPVILEEFGGKMEYGRRHDLYAAAYKSFLESAHRWRSGGGGGGGVLFWDLYHSRYGREGLDYYGGSYGNFVPPPTAAEGAVQDMIKAFSAGVAAVSRTWPRRGRPRRGRPRRPAAWDSGGRIRPGCCRRRPASSGR